MARNSTASVLVLDIGTGMCRPFENSANSSSCSFFVAKEALEHVCQQRLLHAIHDDVGIVLCGSKSTYNDLSHNNDYQHIRILQDLEPVAKDLLSSVAAIRKEQGGYPGDILDALIVAIDMLHKYQGCTKKKNIFIITDAMDPIRDLQDIPKVAYGLVLKGIKLIVLGVGFSSKIPNKLPSLESLSDFCSGEIILRTICKECYGYGEIIPIRSHLGMSAALRRRTINSVTGFRGHLTIGSVKVNVFMYPFSREMKSISAIRVSSIADRVHQLSGKPSVNISRIVMKADDEIPVAIQPDATISGYRYGQSIIPVPVGTEFYSSGEKHLTVLATIHRDAIPRGHLMSAVDAIVPQPDSQQSLRAVATLVCTLNDAKLVFLVRFVKRKNSQPLYGVLFPIIDDDSRYYFGFCRLPFSDDVKKISCPSLPKVSESQQLCAMELIDSLDLTKNLSNDTPSLYEPSITCNPALQHWYDILSFRALYPSEIIPPISATLEASLYADKDILNNAASEIQAFKSMFPLERVVEPLKRDHKDITDNSSSNKKARLDIGFAPSSIGNSSEVAIGTADQLKEYVKKLEEDIATLKKPLGPLATQAHTNVAKVIRMLKEKIENEHSVVELGHASRFLETLRAKCIEMIRLGVYNNHEPLSLTLLFNNFLMQLKGSYSCSKFWEFEKLNLHPISLITDDEDPQFGADANAILGFETTDTMGSKNELVEMNNNTHKGNLDDVDFD